MNKKSQLGFVIINGKENYNISVFDHGLLYGDGVFDTCRVFNGLAFRFQDHLDRLFNSAKLIGLNPLFSKKEIEIMIKKAYKKSKSKDAFIRILITRGVGKQGVDSVCKSNVIIIINKRDFKPLQKVKIIISKIKRNNKNSINSLIKSLNYLNMILAEMDAKDRDADDAILLNEKNNITEATTSNIFIVKSKKIFTPPLSAGILGGITRKVVIEEFPVVEKNLSIKDLMSADEVFLTGTVNFVTSVQSIGNKKLKQFDYSEKVFRKLLDSSHKGIPFV